MTGHEITSLPQFREVLESNPVVVVDFWATWCGPCRIISPIAEKLAEANSNVYYCTVDVDQAEDVSQEYGIRAMPTFILFKNGEKVDEVVGAVPPKLEALFMQAE